MFKAEKWDPDKLVSFYKKIGAQYFFALGNHHDNYDLWDSQYQEWNSVNIGPKKDILAGWAEAAKKNGLPFGISFHAEGYAHTFLNGITLFAWNGQKANIIAQKFWGGCNWRCFNERTAKEESIVMLKDFLAGQAKAMGSIIADSQLLAFSRNMIEETQQKLLQ